MDNAPSAPRKRHALIVDDNTQLAWFFQEILKLHGYGVTVLADGAAALKFVGANHADVVICDLQMPQLEGDLFYATVERTQPKLARRFIFITGVADDERFQKFVRTVDATVLRKPVAVETLLAEIERVVR